MSSDNALRYPEGAQGHVESHFLKANSPCGRRALWIKFTSLLPQRVAELWAIAFADGGREKRALKLSFPLEAQRYQAEPFHLGLPQGELTCDQTRGDLGALRWELRYEARSPAFQPYPLAAMYRGPFPRSKSLTPNPDARFHGWFEAFGERWDVRDWRGCQGHNWGPSHAHAYAWAHSNVLSERPDGAPLEGAWIEALTGRVRLGRVILPWLSVAGITLDGALIRFAGPRAIAARSVSVDLRSYRFTLRQGRSRLEAQFEADAFAGLRYLDPDGAQLSCLNSKLASGRITLEHQGRQRVLYTHQAALEIGTREPAHGVALLA
ncbi:MAG TPA: hypothetical protein VI299_16580 [Polyangiales bacterium]